MTTYTERYDAALLAHAAYLAFPAAADGTEIAGDALREILRPPNAAADNTRFTLEQAVYIASHYTAVAYRDSGADGFQAVVFRKNDSGQRLTLAIRGTEGLFTDFGDFANDALLALATRAWTQTDDVAAFLSDLKVPGAYSLVFPGESIDVVGHSLGGHLAHYANSLSTVGIHHVTTFNGAGNGALLGLPGISFDDPPERVENIISTAGAAVVETFTGATFGSELDVFIESQGEPLGPGNHYMQPTTLNAGQHPGDGELPWAVCVIAQFSCSDARPRSTLRQRVPPPAVRARHAGTPAWTCLGARHEPLTRRERSSGHRE